MRKVIQGHLCSTETARKIAETPEVEVYRNKAGFYFAYSPARKDIVLMTDDQVGVLLSGGTVQIFPAAKPHGIRELRVAAGLTQQQLADAAGIFVRQVQKLESGESKIENLRWHTVLSLADALGISSDKLRSKSARTPEILTIISTFSDFLKYTGITQNQIKKDWKISTKEMRKWIDDEASIPAWVIPMLIELYNVSDRVDYCPLGSAIIV